MRRGGLVRARAATIPCMRAPLAITVVSCAVSAAPFACSSSDPVAASPDAAVEAAPDVAAPPDASCTGDACVDAAPVPKRPFHLGFTPFPFDATAEAVDKVYEYLAKDADLYGFHMLGGVPWNEAGQGAGLAGWGSNIRATFTSQKSKVQPGHAIYLGLTPLNDARAGLADHWGDAEHMPLTPPWDTYTFDAPEVRAAYLKFCEEAVAHYAPDYLAIGIEVNLLKKHSPQLWAGYVTLQRETYQALKAKHPTLPVFVTLTAVDLLDGWTDSDPTAQAQALADVLPYSDYLALSFYPYMSKYTTGPLPKDTFDQLAARAGGKPIAVSETGYPAETFTMSSIPATFEGTPAKQDAWFAQLFAEAEARRFPFLVNFAARDYDALWEKMPDAGKELGLVWRDTGLWAADGTERPALTRWRAALARGR